ncbi:hypothetical protein EDC35_101460 [Thiobaca trueperi]|uniref:Uncharacterized protein n=2 Tax=Thiobaca trueperi TaxID=127458 RepID=A0A4R3N4P2_9GAMM|nr:spermidine synthase [Thiobaca trueperi]TCT24140.1 hypothetical protein EDC35_101460 [Thiobaca trueperi]
MLQKDQLAQIAMILLVWGLAGALFGALFAGLYQVLWILGLPGWQTLMIATAIAAVTTAAFYSAMPIALIGTMAGVLASIGYLMAAALKLNLIAIVGLAGAAGVVAGTLYAWMVTRGSRPLAEILNGLVAGLLTGALLVLTFALTGWQVNMIILAATAVAGVGTLFQLAEGWLVERAARWLPAMLSAPVVAGLIAAVVGASIWFVGGATAAVLDDRMTSAFGQILAHIPAGLLGGFMGGALSGLLLEFLGFRLDVGR